MARLLWVAAIVFLIAGCRSSAQNAAMFDYGNSYIQSNTAGEVANPRTGALEPPCSQFSALYAMDCMERHEKKYGKAAFEKAFRVPESVSKQAALFNNSMGCEKSVTAAEVRSIMVEVMQQYGVQQSGEIRVDNRYADGPAGPKPSPSPDKSGVRSAEGHRAGWDALQGFETTAPRPPPTDGGRAGGGGPGESLRHD